MPWIEKDEDGNVIGVFNHEHKNTEYTEEAAVRYKDDDTLKHEAFAPTESNAVLARKIEDIIDFIENGTPLPKSSKDWNGDRKTLRGE